MQQKLAKRDGTPIDRNRDAEHVWEFYEQFKKRHRVDDIQKADQRMRESGTFSANMGEYVFPHVDLLSPCLLIILIALFFIDIVGFSAIALLVIS